MAIFATLSLLSRPCTEYPSAFNDIVGRCNVIISDEFTQVLQAKGLHLFRYQQNFREHQCLRFVLGDLKQLPAYALSFWYQNTCMRGILSTQLPLSLYDQLCKHWNSTWSLESNPDPCLRLNCSFFFKVASFAKVSGAC